MLAEVFPSCPLKPCGFGSSVEGGNDNIPLFEHPPSPHRFDASLDWLSFSIPVSSIIDVENHINYLDNILVDEFDVTPGRTFQAPGGQLFHNTARSTRGCHLRWNLPHEAKDGVGKLLIQINGKSLAPLNMFERVDIIHTFESVPGARCTRIDPALDDYQYIVTEEQLHDAQDKGNFSGFSKCGFYSSRRRNTRAGYTFTFGSRKSGYYLRIYDKCAESNGEKVCLRWELEAKQGRSEEIAKLIASCIGYNEQQLQQLIVDLITGSIKFIERRDNTNNLDRMKPLQWWVDFLVLLAAAPLKFALPKPERTLEKSKAWLNRQVVTTLAVCSEVMGPNEFPRFIRELVSDGLTRFTSYHDAVVAQAKKLTNLTHPPTHIPPSPCQA